jgi:flagellar basal-body rod protein FlgC
MIGGALFAGMNASASGMSAEKLRMDIIANNIANINTTRTPKGGPYRRQIPIFAPRTEQIRFTPPFIKARFRLGNGVRVVRIEEDDAPFRMEYIPGHPDADENGYVRFPNINIATEMVDLITASRAYEANAVALRSAKQMMMKALEI